MALDRITLSAFRNHRGTRIDGTRRFNLLVGDNGAGKTNVLEAISLFAPGRGLRRAGLAEMATQGRTGDPCGGFSVSVQLDCGDGAEPVALGTGTQPARPGRRQVQVNGADTSAVSLGEWLAVSWLTPAMDRLFADGAGALRRFMDRMALALEPAHARHAARYDNALRERGRLLAGDDEPDPRWMDGIEAQLGESGAALAGGRTRLIARLCAELERLPDEPFARPALSLTPGGPAEAQALAEELRRTRRRDRAARRTLTGPHRDTLEVSMAGKRMPAAHCSTGEQKALLISIILAHASLAAHGGPSVLLLDEIAAHLDPQRRAVLFERLRASGAQIWLTGTELAPFGDIAGDMAAWRVADGGVTRVD